MIKKLILSILGASNFVMDVSFPFIIGLIWWNLSGTDVFSMIFLVICILATIFRVIKIGWRGFL